MNQETKVMLYRLLDTLENQHSSIWPQRRSFVTNNKSELHQFYNSNPNSPLQQKTANWIDRKLLREDLIFVEGVDYSFYINPVLNLMIGRDKYTSRSTYLNSRGVVVDGRIGKDITFQTTFIESQGYMSEFFNEYYRSKGSTLGWTLHRGYSRTGFDFPFSVGQVAYNAGRYFNFSAGHGNHFFGEGYRSLFLDDHTIPYGFFRIETDVWKFRYINLFTVMSDITRANMTSGRYLPKYGAIHYLSWNISKRFNLSFFESMIIGSDTLGIQRGFDINYLNPIILYRALEANRGFNMGNAMIGVAASYAVKKRLKVYTQVAFDDFSFEGIRNLRAGHFLNFFAWQVGLRNTETFGVKNLFWLAELNQARPFMYSHRSTISNYEHLGLPLAHPWETNFREFVFMTHYTYHRWEIQTKVNFGFRGTDTSDANWGNDIRRSYQDLGNGLLGYFTGSPVRRNIFQASIRVGFILQPIVNMRLEASYFFRGENFSQEHPSFNAYQSNWFTVGIRTALFGWKDDFALIR
ncbi:hypothetical protein [Schleiferia thermophila]|uniref:hypothetical protein n=1 Tax=Schleiferia thermophila TaxID=884107 RepID=UPI002FD94113